MIDLHLHTNHSDGTDSVEQLLKNAQKLNMEIISITDHDTINAYKEIENNKHLLDLYNGKIITGVEIKAIYNGYNIEVLGYGFDYNKLIIRKPDVEKIQIENLEYFKSVAKRYGLRIDESICVNRENPTQRWGAMVFSEELIKYPENIERLKELNEADFSKMNFYRDGESNKNSVFYVDTSKYYPTIEQVIEDIHNAGGLAFLAHPCIYPFENIEKEVENILSSTYIDGVECKYPLFSNEQKDSMKNLCKKYNKYMSGGSDYHADFKPDVNMGTGINNNLNISKELVSDWISQLEGFCDRNKI